MELESIINMTGTIVTALIAVFFTIKASILQTELAKMDIDSKNKANLLLYEIPEYIVLRNEGPCFAKNIRIAIMNSDETNLVFCKTGMIDYHQLSCSETIKIRVMYQTRFDCSAPIIKIIWDDKYERNREKVVNMKYI